MLNGDFIFASIWIYLYLIIYTTIILGLYTLIICNIHFNDVYKTYTVWSILINFLNNKSFYKLIYIIYIFSLAGVPPFALFWVKILILQKILKFNNIFYFLFFIFYFLFLLYFYLKYVKILLPLNYTSIAAKFKYPYIFSSVQSNLGYKPTIFSHSLIIFIVIFLTLLPLIFNDIIILFKYVFSV